MICNLCLKPDPVVEHQGMQFHKDCLLTVLAPYGFCPMCGGPRTMDKCHPVCLNCAYQEGCE